MKKKLHTFVTICLAVIMLCFSLPLSACARAAAIVPKANHAAVTSFDLDVYGNFQKTLHVSDLIDENGADGVTYHTKKNNSNVNISEMIDGEFCVIAVQKGGAIVTLEALQNNQVKVSVVLSFSIADSTPIGPVNPDPVDPDPVDPDPVDPDPVDPDPVDPDPVDPDPVDPDPVDPDPVDPDPVDPDPVDPDPVDPGGSGERPDEEEEEPEPTEPVTPGPEPEGSEPDDPTPPEEPETELPEEPSGTGGFAGGFYNNPASWVDVAGDSGINYTHDAVIMSDGSLLFVASNQRYPNAFANEIVSGVANDTAYQYSFMLNAQGSFTLRLLATDSTTRTGLAGNRLDFQYNGSVFTFSPAVGGDIGSLARISAKDAGYQEGAWNRIDIIIISHKKALSSGNTVSSWAANDSGVLEVQIFINNKKVSFKVSGNSTTGIMNFGSGRTYRLVSGTPYIQRLSSSNGSGSRFGRNMIIQTANAETSVSALRIANVSATGLRNYPAENISTAIPAKFYTASNWSRLAGVSSGLSAPARVTNAAGGEELQFNTAGSLGITLSHSATQNFRFMVKSNASKNDTFRIRFRVSDTDATYYELANSSGRFSLRKSNGVWQAIAADTELLQTGSWNRIDILVTDEGANRTRIDIYVNARKIMFVRHEASESNFEFGDGGIIDINKPLRGSRFGIITTGQGVQIKPFTASAASNKKFTATDFLKVSGQSIKKNKGSGSALNFRGVNAGGYLVIETWMSGFANYSHKKNTSILNNRFGHDKTVALWEQYRANFWTEQDFQNCADMGMNAIRLPFSYMNVDPEFHNVKAVTGEKYNFETLDWFIRTAEKYGIYTILDLHGAYGSQNGKEHSGEALSHTQVDFFSNTEKQNKTIDLWKAIAARYKNDPAVAAYDLLNEPGPVTASGGMGTTQKPQWDFYNKLYQAVRSVDPDHIIMIEACWTGSNLPHPTNSSHGYKWSNVIYQFHNYPENRTSASSILSSMQGKLNGVHSQGFGIPYYMGEFNCYQVESAWKNVLKLFNDDSRWSWTPWSYKLIPSASTLADGSRGGWAMYFADIGSSRINTESDSYDTILSKIDRIRTDDPNTFAFNFESQNSLFDIMKGYCV